MKEIFRRCCQCPIHAQRTLKPAAAPLCVFESRIQVPSKHDAQPLSDGMTSMQEGSEEPDDITLLIAGAAASRIPICLFANSAKPNAESGGMAIALPSSTLPEEGILCS